MDKKEPKATPIPVEVTFVPNDGKPVPLPPLLTRPRERALVMENTLTLREIERRRLMEERRRHVGAMNANMRLEGLVPDTSDKALQAKYIKGEASLYDLLAHAYEYARKCEVQSEMIAALMESDVDDGDAARQHLAAGRPITFYDERFPDKIIRKWPDGRHEFVDVDLKTGEVISLGEIPAASL